MVKSRHRQLSKTFRDTVHGLITLPPVCVAIIDDPVFQRLRGLKQLGTVHLVFPTASHTRFEHSLGVSYLAGKMARHLRRVQPQLGITDAEITCCQVAGLCHDLGHGILSHSFDQFVHQAGCDEEWTHEKGSLMLLDDIVARNDAFKREFGFCGLGASENLVMIKEMILGCPSKAPAEWKWTGRPGKEFLFQIVANQQNGIDVDKFDYLARDARAVDVNNAFDAKRLIKSSRVLSLHGTMQICFDVKEFYNVHELFKTRYSMHKRVYQHRVVHATSAMMIDALLSADKAGFAPLLSSQGEFIKVSHATTDMVAYTSMTDCVLHQLQYSNEPQFEEARTLLQRVSTRKLYKLVGEHAIGCSSSESLASIKKQVLEFVVAHDESSALSGSSVPTTQKKVADEVQEQATTEATTEATTTTATPKTTKLQLKQQASLSLSSVVTPDDLYVCVFTIDYGMGNLNPVDRVGFYNKRGALALKDNQVVAEHMLSKQVKCEIPKAFSQTYLRLYLKSLDVAKLETASRAWQAWLSAQPDSD